MENSSPLSETEPPTHTTPPPPQNIVIHQDHSPLPLTVILDETNYPLWSQLMDMRIGARNKIGFLTGDTPKPNPDDPSLASWITDNKRVKSWLIDSMNPSLMQRFLRLETASEIWEAASKTFYDGSDESCLFDLNQKSFTTRQHGRPLAIYYSELLAIFQEIDHRTSASETVAHLVHQHSALSRLRVHIFLAGLDPEFDQVRSEILRKDPKLDLESSYAYVRKDSQQRQTMNTPKPSPDTSALLTHQPRFNSSLNPKPRRDHGNPKPPSFTCSHCGEIGHSKQRCYELIGYPDWWDFTKRPRKKVLPKATVTIADAVPAPPKASVVQSSILGKPLPSLHIV